jgi:glycerol kinase
VPLFAGVDPGTSGTRTILVDEEGRSVAGANRRSATAHPAPGWDEQDGPAHPGDRGPSRARSPSSPRRSRAT